MSDFFAIMDEDSSELHHFSVEIFDKYIHPRAWLLDGGRRTGTGCWGHEMNEGDLVYIFKLKVEPQVRQ
jgi:hypothetical protein